VIHRKLRVLGAAVLWAAAFPLAAHAPANDPGAAPYAPFRISEQVYYVGAADYASYLLTTKAGLIVIDAPQYVDVAGNIRKLGFDPKQVKILLNTHGHFDHAGGLAELKRQTSAKLYVSATDGELIARGGKGDFFFRDRFPYDAVTPDRVLKNGDKVTLGGLTLTANLTPGHTRGCTTWTFRTPVSQGPRTVQRDALIHCSSSVLPGYRLVGEETYPGQRADYERSLAFWLKAPCELFLSNHARFFRMAEKRKAVVTDGAAFVDPQGCRTYYEGQQKAFEAELARQQAAAQR
jgi:metallo-beta-lactamase class B